VHKTLISAVASELEVNKLCDWPKEDEDDEHGRGQSGDLYDLTRHEPETALEFDFDTPARKLGHSSAASATD
jgi:hypothetical protein